jgi:hypothetical protein
MDARHGAGVIFEFVVTAERNVHVVAQFGKQSWHMEEAPVGAEQKIALLGVALAEE